MTSRQLAILIGAVAGAFVLAFGIGQAAGGGDGPSSGAEAQVIGVDAPSVGRFAGSGGVPALEAGRTPSRARNPVGPKVPTTPRAKVNPAPTAAPFVPPAGPRVKKPESTPESLGTDDGIN